MRPIDTYAQVKHVSGILPAAVLGGVSVTGSSFNRTGTTTYGNFDGLVLLAHTGVTTGSPSGWSIVYTVQHAPDVAGSPGTFAELLDRTGNTQRLTVTNASPLASGVNEKNIDLGAADVWIRVTALATFTGGGGTISLEQAATMAFSCSKYGPVN